MVTVNINSFDIASARVGPEDVTDVLVVCQRHIRPQHIVVYKVHSRLYVPIHVESVYVYHLRPNQRYKHEPETSHRHAL